MRNFYAGNPARDKKFILIPHRLFGFANTKIHLNDGGGLTPDFFALDDFFHLAEASPSDFQINRLLDKNAQFLLQLSWLTVQ